MNVKELQEIVKLMETSKLSEFVLEEDNFKLSLKRETGNYIVAPQAVAPVAHFEAPVTQKDEATDVVDDKLIHFIKAPMVGTFYGAPSPDSRPFVEKREKVSKETVVCILEAMKVMNEIHAECSGEILEILVENGSPVEYGQNLFKIKLDK